MEQLTYTSLKLKDLYNLQIETTSNETINLFANQEIVLRQEALINKTKLQCL